MGSIRKKGSRWYYRYYDHLGKRHEIALGTANREIAQRLARIYDEQLKTGKSPEILREATLAEVISTYLNFISPQKSPQTMKDYNTIASRILHYLEDVKISKLRAFDIAQALNRMEKEGLSLETRRKTLMLLRQVIRFAVKKGYIGEDITEGIKIHKDKRPKRLRFFSVEELKQIFEKADELYPDVANIFRFLYYTGLRRSELVTLQWRDVDFKHKVLRIQDSKSPNGYRRIPLRDEAIAILKSLPKINEWVFVNPATQRPWDRYFLSKSFKRVLKHCGIKNASLHTLRHTFASHLAMEGVPLDIIRDLLGHSSVVVTEIYAHLAPDHIQTAIKRLPSID